MSDQKPDRTGLSRRGFLGTAALSGAAGLVGGAHLTGAHAKDSKAGGQSGHIAPGELDEYYAFNSGGQSGDRKRVVEGKRVSVRVEFGGSRILKKKQKTKTSSEQ